MKIDLHVHTNASDGKYPVEEIIKMAYDNGVRVLAITDHDTVAAIPRAVECAKNYPDLTLIPGIEMSSTYPGCEVHILGYFVDWKDPHFLEQLQEMRESRVNRAAAMVEKCRELGMDITMDRVREIAGDANIGRPHIAHAILEKGYAATWDEVFDKYLGHGGQAYVERVKLSPYDAVCLLHEAKGIVSFAHPFLTSDYKAILPQLLKANIEGMETYYKTFNDEQRKELKKCCQENNLIPTGGTDFHGIEDDEIFIGESGIPNETVLALLDVAHKRGRL
jgi:predicted metal-dependent phosphoesterase TrpH